MPTEAPELATEEKTPSGATDKRVPKTRVRAGTLAAALKDVTELVQAKVTVPIVGHVLFAAGEGAIHLTGTDLDAWISRDCETADRDGPGSKGWLESIRPFSLTLPARHLASLVGAFDSDAMVTIEAKDARAVVSCGRSRVTLNCLPAEDFPLGPPVEMQCSFEIACSVLADALAAVDHAISTEETRYYLNGVYAHVHEEGLRLVATDGHRLARLTIDLPDGAAGFPGAIVPRRIVAVLGKLLAAAARLDKDDQPPGRILIESALEGQRLRLTLPATGGGEIEIVAKMVDGSFPDYARIIPSETAHTLRIDKGELDHAIRLVSLLADEKGRGVRVAVSEAQVTLSLASPEVGEASEEIPAAFDGPEFETRFNGGYWREALAAAAADTVVMRFAAEPGGKDMTAPVVLEAETSDGTPPRLLQLIMAMRV